MKLSKSWDLLSHKTPTRAYKQKHKTDYTPVILALYLRGAIMEKILILGMIILLYGAWDTFKKGW